MYKNMNCVACGEPASHFFDNYKNIPLCNNIACETYATDRVNDVLVMASSLEAGLAGNEDVLEVVKENLL